MTLPPELTACIAASAPALAKLTVSYYQDQTKADTASAAGLRYVRTELNENEVKIRLSKALGLPPRNLPAPPGPKTTRNIP
ncbi:hypothetical protein [Acetobacter musti]|nr:hypothetical protein [Acetobacter musti]